MKRLIIKILLFVLPILVYGQQYETRLNDTGKLEMIIVSDKIDKTAEELYQNTIEWVAYTFVNTESVTQSQIENKMIRFSGISQHVINRLGFTFDLGYLIQIDIKDNKIRFQANNIDIIGTPYQRNSIEGIILKKNGELKNTKIASETNNETNDELVRIYKSLFSFCNEGHKVNNDW